MNPIADVDCVLDVDVHCDACKMKMMDVLSSIAGVYSVAIDGEQGKVKVRGEVDPNILMMALSRAGLGNHGKLLHANINHPLTRRMPSYGYDSYNYGSNYGCWGSNYYDTIEDPYNHGRPFLGGHSSYNYSQPMDNCYQTRRYSNPFFGSTYYRKAYAPAPPPPPFPRRRHFHY